MAGYLDEAFVCQVTRVLTGADDGVLRGHRILICDRDTKWSEEECLNRVVVLGEGHLRRTLTAFMAHYHRERNHQGLHDRLIAPEHLAPPGSDGSVRCRERLAGLLRYYHRSA